ncbi:alpha/beta hydrolase [Dietzia lutea]|uniref:Esterase n=1 Tax=Dietzia lutea TaxID=546160 RepID=A0A2S1R9N5_9ACTN|nr:alpha/beta hydrolase family protein [Dietzia lutea]AWH92965.1 hypothetical protein A6035_13160 [Dietzia lutea]
MAFPSLRLPVAGALALALALGVASPAAAQPELDLSSLSEQQLGSIIEGVGSVPVGSTADLLGAVGSADLPLTGEGSSMPVETPRPVDPRITTSEFVEVERTEGEYQYWLVRSAAMHREVILEVVPSRVSDKAPVLYMLDGVDAPEGDSGWNHRADIASRMADENVHVVAPTGAGGAYWTDWENADSALGYNKWETFITEELPGIIEQGLASMGESTTGKAAIGGASAGAQAAMHLAATYPELYDGVMAFSGYYSTMDGIGYQNLRLAVELRGGDLENMWGPYRSERWRENDTVSHVEGLAEMPVYFSTGSGEIGPDDLGYYGADMLGVVLGIIIERGSLEGAQALERALNAEGIDHRVDYLDTGLHNWPTFLENFDEAWEYIEPSLQQA